MTLYLVADNTDPASASLTRLVPACVANREFASFPQALGDRPASRDVSRTVARLRDHDRGPLDLLPYELTAGPIPNAIPLAAMRESDETTRRIERAALGLAAVMVGVIVLRVGGGL